MSLGSHAIVPDVTVYVILDTRTNPDHLLGDAIETFIRRVDAERFIEEVRGDDSALRRARANRVLELPADRGGRRTRGGFRVQDMTKVTS
jgi:hypothetical protein